jgi:hypothetical protein
MPLDTTVVALIGTATTLTAATLGPLTTRRLARFAARREWSQRAAEAYAAGRHAQDMVSGDIRSIELASAAGQSMDQHERRVAQALDAATLLRASAATAPTPQATQLAEELAERINELAVITVEAMNLGTVRRMSREEEKRSQVFEVMRDELVTRRVKALSGPREGSLGLRILFERFRDEVSREHWSRSRWRRRSISAGRALKKSPPRHRPDPHPDDLPTLPIEDS